MCYVGSKVNPVTVRALLPPMRHAQARFRSDITRRQTAMIKHTKARQAGLILFATTLLLIVPNLTKVFG